MLDQHPESEIQEKQKNYELKKKHGQFTLIRSSSHRGQQSQEETTIPKIPYTTTQGK